MITISIKALGPLKQKIQLNDALEIEEAMSIFAMLDKVYGMKRLETSRYNFVVNGKLQKGDYAIQNQDSITVLKMGGAG